MVFLPLFYYYCQMLTAILAGKEVALIGAICY